MIDRIFRFGTRDLVALKMLQDYETLSNEQYARKLFDRVGLIAELMQSLHDQGVKLPTWKIWSEAVVIKFCFHVSTLLKLYSGTEIPVPKNGENAVVFDEPSVIVLFRTILENYLTFFYLYVDNVPEAEKEFRFLVYEYSGMRQRTRFQVTSEEMKKKQDGEVIETQKLKDRIKGSPFYQSLNKKTKEKIIDGKHPRFFNWGELLIKCGFREDLFKNIYGYKSTYTHSEFISLMQIKDKSYGYVPDGKKQHYTLLLLHMILSKFIKDLTEVFYSIKLLYNTKDKDLITEVEILHNMVTDNKIDQDLRSA